MKFKLSPETLSQGRDSQARSQATPENQGSRMAGDRIADFRAMMKQGGDNDSNEWNNRFSQSNEGAAFNIAKMNGGQIPDEGGQNA